MKENSKRKWPYVVFAVFMIILISLYAYLYIFPNITDTLTPTYIVQQDSYLVTDEPKCIVVRDEEVIYAEKTGTLTYYSKETEKTRKGFVVADIYSGSKNSYSCPVTGFVSYYIDGYEDYFTPNNIGLLDVNEYADLEVVPENTVRNEAQIGQPIYKLIKSNTWYLLLIVSEDDLNKYTMNGNITVQINETDSISAKVVRFLGDGEKRVVVASTKLFYKDFAKLRTLNVNVITKETDGYSIPTSAICTKDGKTGIYVLGVDEDYVFKEITILVDGDDMTLISSDGNIKLYDEILRNGQNDSSAENPISE